MKTNNCFILRLIIVFLALFTQLILTPMSNAADTAEPAKDPVLEAKKREADLAEAELRLQTALKATALAKKDAQTAANEDLQRAEQQKSKAQAELAIAEAEKAKFTAGLPASTSKPLDGKIDLDDKAGYFSDILAFESVGDGAIKIATNVVANLGTSKKIYLVKQGDYIKGALQLKEIDQRLTTFSGMFDALVSRYKIQDGAFAPTEAAPLLGLAALPAVVGALADVAAMFRVDRSLKGRATTVTDEALIAEVADALRRTANNSNPPIQIEIFRPSLDTKPDPAILATLATARTKSDTAALRLAEIRGVLASATNMIDQTASKIAKKQAKLEKLATDSAAERKDVKDEIKRLRILFDQVAVEKKEERDRIKTAIDEQIKELTRLQKEEKSQSEALETELTALNEDLVSPKFEKAQAEVAVTQFEATIKAFSDFTAKLVSVPDGGTNSPLATLAETSALQSLPAEALILAVAVSGQGGELETRKSIWTSGRVYHRAGTACAYTLFSPDSKIAAAGLAVSNRQAKEGKRINQP